MTPASPMAARLAVLQSGYLRVCEALGAFLMGLIVFITSYQVFYRYMLGDSLVWAEEACRGLLVWTCFLFAGVAFQRGEMIAVDIIDTLLSPRVRTLLVAPTYLVTSVFLMAMVYFGWNYAWQNLNQTMPGLEMLWQSLSGTDSIFPIFWMYLAVPVGFALLAVHMALSGIKLASAPLAQARGPRREG
jgi:TRAP-type C4-dicarboxylate transport system permease small subunit